MIFEVNFFSENPSLWEEFLSKNNFWIVLDQKLLKEIIPSFFTTRRNSNQDFYSASVFEAKSLETLNFEERMFSGDQNLLEKLRSKISFLVHFTP